MTPPDRLRIPPHPARAADDIRLLEHVRPPGWVNPEPRERYDLVVIGAGTGGLVSAAIGAALGARVALVERDRMGGDCLNTGCVPSKTLLRAARSWAEARASATRFGGPEATGAGDFAAAAARMRRVRAQIAPADGAARFREMGVDVFFGEARFDSERSVRVGSVPLEFRRAILATGARPAVPPIPGLREAGFLTSETVFDLDRVPERLLVLGAGPIGCELAQAFARFGSRVTLLDMEARLLPREEEGAAAVVHAALARDGVQFVGEARVTEAEGSGDGVAVGYERLGRNERAGADALLVAVGRRPNVDLDLDTAGIAHDRHGVRTDDRLRTTNRRVFAVGDVTSRHQFTHVADAHARMAVRNALFFGRSRASRLVIPWATYTDPEVGRVGLSGLEAREQGVDIETVTVEMADVDRARLEGAEEGFVRIHMRAGKDEIVGATVVSPHAGDLIAQVAQAMSWGVGLERLADVIFPYPTTAEALRKAADSRRRGKLTPKARKAFGAFFKVWRWIT